MCDFHDFGRTFFSVFELLKMSKNVFLGGIARLPQRLKSTFFEIFSSLCCKKSQKRQTLGFLFQILAYYV